MNPEHSDRDLQMLERRAKAKKKRVLEDLEENVRRRLIWAEVKRRVNESCPDWAVEDLTIEEYAEKMRGEEGRERKR